MAVSTSRQRGHTIATRGGYMSPVPVYQVVIHPNEDDVPGYWAEYHTEKGGAFTDGDTVKETQANMYESMSLFLQDDYPDITDFSLEFIMGEPVTSNG